MTLTLPTQYKVDVIARTAAQFPVPVDVLTATLQSSGRPTQQPPALGGAGPVVDVAHMVRLLVSTQERLRAAEERLGRMPEPASAGSSAGQASAATTASGDTAAAAARAADVARAAALEVQGLRLWKEQAEQVCGPVVRTGMHAHACMRTRGSTRTAGACGGRGRSRARPLACLPGV